MAWTQRDNVTPGNGIIADVVGGVTLDLFSTITLDDMLQRARQFANGWTVTRVQWERGVFGIGETLRIIGRADESLPTALIRQQMENAVNSFWMIASADVQVLVADSANENPPDTARDSIKDTIQIVAVALIVIGIAWGIKQVKDISQ